MSQYAVPAAPSARIEAAADDVVRGAAMRDRVPAQSLIERVLLLQAGARTLSGLERLLGRDPLTPEARPWFVGAAGERTVAARLAALPAGWTVLHSLPLGRNGADIDHLVVGPGGVFTVNTKHHVDASVWVAGRTVLVAGARQSYVPKAEAEARRVDRIVAGALAVAPAVLPVVAVVGARRITVRRGPERVAVVAAEGLSRFLLAQPRRLTSQQVDDLVAVLDDPGSWQPAAEAGPELLLAYARLTRQIAGAARIRRSWVALGGLSAFGVPVAVLWTLPVITGAIAH